MAHIIWLDYLYIKEILPWIRNNIQQDKGETRTELKKERRNGKKKRVKFCCHIQTCGKEIVSAVFFFLKEPPSPFTSSSFKLCI